MSEMTRDERQSRLYRALGEAVKHAVGVSKASQNSHQRYNYASSEHVILAADEAMSPYGLSVIPTTASVVVEGEYEKNDNSGTRLVPMHVLKRGFLLVHEDGGEVAGEMAWPLEINRGKGVDKAAGSAETTCYAYYLRSLLRMPRLDQDDMNYVRDRESGAAGGQSTAPAVDMPNPQLAALVDRIRAIDSAEKLAAAGAHVGRIADGVEAGTETRFTASDVAVLLDELEQKR